MTPIETYRARFSETPGYFEDGAISAWDFLLSIQSFMKVRGNFMEIGVLHGKSALLGACHLLKDEWCILNDINPIDRVVEAIRGLNGPSVHVASTKSIMLPTLPELRSFQGTARWIHVDGDHSGHSALNDLHAADKFLADKGIICVDDFFSARYPQVAAAVFVFLERTAPAFRMLMCGDNKAYLVRTADFPLYESLVRKDLANHFRISGILRTIHKSTYTHDWGCFSIGPREQNLDYCGLDANAAEIPF